MMMERFGMLLRRTLPAPLHKNWLQALFRTSVICGMPTYTGISVMAWAAPCGPISLGMGLEVPLTIGYTPGHEKVCLQAYNIFVFARIAWLFKEHHSLDEGMAYRLLS